MKYNNKTTVALNDNQKEILTTISNKSNNSQAETYRELIETAHEAGGLSVLKEAVKQFNDGDDFTYVHDEYDGVLSADWLTHQYETATPLNPDHVSPSQLPKKSSDKAAVLHGMAIYMGVTNVALEDPQESPEMMELIWEYVGMSEHIENTYCDLIAKIHRINNDKATYHRSIIKYSDKSNGELETIIEHIDGAQKRAAEDLLKRE